MTPEERDAYNRGYADAERKAVDGLLGAMGRRASLMRAQEPELSDVIEKMAQVIRPWDRCIRALYAPTHGETVVPSNLPVPIVCSVERSYQFGVPKVTVRFAAFGDEDHSVCNDFSYLDRPEFFMGYIEQSMWEICRQLFRPWTQRILSELMRQVHQCR